MGAKTSGAQTALAASLLLVVCSTIYFVAPTEQPLLLGTPFPLPPLTFTTDASVNTPAERSSRNFDPGDCQEGTLGPENSPGGQGKGAPHGQGQGLEIIRLAAYGGAWALSAQGSSNAAQDSGAEAQEASKEGAEEGAKEGSRRNGGSASHLRCPRTACPSLSPCLPLGTSLGTGAAGGQGLRGRVGGRGEGESDSGREPEAGQPDGPLEGLYNAPQSGIAPYSDSSPYSDSAPSTADGAPAPFFKDNDPYLASSNLSMESSTSPQEAPSSAAACFVEGLADPPGAIGAGAASGTPQTGPPRVLGKGKASDTPASSRETCNLQLSPFDRCQENVAGLFGELVKPGCVWYPSGFSPDFSSEEEVPRARSSWSMRGIGARQGVPLPAEAGAPGAGRGGWAGQVFVLRNVYLDSHGRVYNATHRFDAGGCSGSEEELAFPPPSALTTKEDVVNLMASAGHTTCRAHPATPGTPPYSGPGVKQAALLHAVASELPLLPVVESLLPRLNSPVLGTHNIEFHQDESPLLFPGTSMDALLQRSAVPAAGAPWFAKRLIQPVFQPCGQPSPSLWRRVRAQHLLPSYPNTPPVHRLHSTGEAAPLVPPVAPLIPHNWVVVVHRRALGARLTGTFEQSQRVKGRTGRGQRVNAPTGQGQRGQGTEDPESGPTVESLLLQYFPPGRILVSSSTTGSLADERAAFHRAVLFVTVDIESMASVIFMPPNATVLQLRTLPRQGAQAGLFGGTPQAGPAHQSGTPGLPASLADSPRQLAAALAEACELRTYITFCNQSQPSVDPQQPTVYRQQPLAHQGHLSLGEQEPVVDQQQPPLGAEVRMAQTGPQVTCSHAAVIEAIDRASYDAYAAYPPKRVRRPILGEPPALQSGAPLTLKAHSSMGTRSEPDGATDPESARGTYSDPEVASTNPQPKGSTDSEADEATGLEDDRGADAEAEGGTDAEAEGGTDSEAEGNTDAEAEGGTDSEAEGGTDSEAEGGTDAEAEGGPLWFRMSVERVGEFLKWTECVAHRGEWTLNPIPRSLPWNAGGTLQKCDLMHTGLGLGIAGAQADAAAAAAVAAAAAAASGALSNASAGAAAAPAGTVGAAFTTTGAGNGSSAGASARASAGAGRASGWGWTVRETLKYEWEVPSSCPPLPDGASAGTKNIPTPMPHGTPDVSSRKLLHAAPNPGTYPDLSSRDPSKLEQAQRPHPNPEARPKPFDEFWGPTFCQRVGRNRTFLIIGDSLQDQFTEALVNNMLRHIPKPATWAAPRKIPPECRDWLPLNKRPTLNYCRDIRFRARVCPGMRVVYIRSLYLLLGGPRDTGHMQFTRLPFLNDADVILLNRGAHYEVTPKYERDLTALFRYLRNRLPQALIIFRNTPPGHDECAKADKPLRMRQDPRRLPYDWGKFQEQNRFAEKLAEEHDVVYMDADAMLALQPDGHRGVTKAGVMDCLHYCMPGPIDSVVQLFYNILLWVAPL